MYDLVEDRRHLAEVLRGEDGVEHLALFLVLSTVRRQQARTNKETSVTAMIKDVRKFTSLRLRTELTCRAPHPARRCLGL